MSNLTTVNSLEYIHMTTSCYIGDPERSNRYPHSLNPFLDEDEDGDNISSAGSFYSVNLPPNYPPPLPPSMAANLKLPAFWADAPMAWFAAREAQFQLRRVSSQSEKFCHVTAALDKLYLKKVVHLVITPHPVLPHNKLKEALLASHQLTDFKRVELLLAVEPLGGRKPSELLPGLPTGHRRAHTGHQRFCYTCGGRSLTEGQSRR